MSFVFLSILSNSINNNKQFMNLLEKAKQSRRPKKMQPMSEEKIELAVAWLKDEITMSQVADALGCKDVSAYVTLARGAKHYFKTLPETECINKALQDNK